MEVLPGLGAKALPVEVTLGDDADLAESLAALVLVSSAFAEFALSEPQLVNLLHEEVSGCTLESLGLRGDLPEDLLDDVGEVRDLFEALHVTVSCECAVPFFLETHLL